MNVLRPERSFDLMDVWECALGFMDAQTLLTAHDVGVFDALARGPSRAEDVAAAVDLPEDSTLRLLTMLCALDLVRREADGRFVNAPEADEKLVRCRRGYIGAMFAHVQEDLYPLWRHLGDALRERTPQWTRAFGGTPRNDEMFSDPARLRAFMEGMHAITYPSARELAARVPALGALDRIVDVGGASGAFLIALAEAFPALRGTVLDLPAVRPIAEEIIARSGLSHRIEFHAADFFVDPIPEGASAYTLGFVLHDWDDEGGSIILDKIARASRAGTLLIVGEMLLEDDRTGPLCTARQDLNMLVAARGRERSTREYREWIGRFGFDLQDVTETAGGKRYLLAHR